MPINIPTAEDFDTLIARIDKMAEWAKGIEKWAKLTDQEIIGLKDLATDLRGKDAVNFHMLEKPEPPKDWKFDVNKAKEILTDPANSEIKIEMPSDL